MVCLGIHNRQRYAGWIGGSHNSGYEELHLMGYKAVDYKAICKISGTQRGSYECLHLLGYNTVESVCEWMFLRTLSSSSVSNISSARTMHPRSQHSSDTDKFCKELVHFHCHFHASIIISFERNITLAKY
jgi:hypothetical protein